MTTASGGGWGRPRTSAAASVIPGRRSPRRLHGSMTTWFEARESARCGSYPHLTVTEYTIRRSDRAQRLRIVVAPTGVEVVVPRRMALRHAEEFVAEKRRWIERTL